MKYLLAVIWTFICVSVLLYGHVHWNKQTAVKAVKTEPASDHAPVFEQTSNDPSIDKYIELAANWPDSAKEQLKQSSGEGKPYKILFVGSTEMQWEKEVTQSLTESYGSERITTGLQTYNLTSNDFVADNKQLDLAAEKAQLIVIEPFLLNDNGNITINITLANLTKIIEDIKAENPDTTFILQPSYPIYLPKYYSIQVESLKEYAAENNITFLDHWSAWPATDDPEINEFLNENRNGPNEKGYHAWGQYLIEYLIKK